MQKKRERESRRSLFTFQGLCLSAIFQVAFLVLLCSTSAGRRYMIVGNLAVYKSSSSDASFWIESDLCIALIQWHSTSPVGTSHPDLFPLNRIHRDKEMRACEAKEEKENLTNNLIGLTFVDCMASCQPRNDDERALDFYTRVSSQRNSMKFGHQIKLHSFSVECDATVRRSR